jgi:hypothetical protein
MAAFDPFLPLANSHRSAQSRHLMDAVMTCRTDVSPHRQCFLRSNVGYYVSVLPASEPESPTIESFGDIGIGSRLIIAADRYVPISQATDLIPSFSDEDWRCAADIRIGVQDLSRAESVTASL